METSGQHASMVLDNGNSDPERFFHIYHSLALCYVHLLDELM